jgi:hypothetical protein
LARSSKSRIVGSLLSWLGFSGGDDPLNAISLGVDNHEDHLPDSAKDDEAVLVISALVLDFLAIRIVEYTTGILKPYPRVLALVLEILFWVPFAS